MSLPLDRKEVNLSSDTCYLSSDTCHGFHSRQGVPMVWKSMISAGPHQTIPSGHGVEGASRLAGGLPIKLGTTAL